MAVITPVITQKEGGTHLVLWEAMTSAGSDTATAVSFAGARDKTVQVVGTIGGATLSMEGSNDGTNFFPLLQPDDTNACAFTAVGGSGIIENPLWIKPVLTGGSGTDVDVYLLCGRSI